MSEMEENVKPMDSESPLDRLVDGELSESDRSELLLQLEHEPEGWRRCALAFLEAQCWKQEFGLMSGGAVEQGIRGSSRGRRAFGAPWPNGGAGTVAAAIGDGLVDGRRAS